MEDLAVMAGPLGPVLLLLGIAALFVSLWCLLYTELSFRGFRKLEKRTPPGSQVLLRDLTDYQGRNPGLLFLREIFQENPRDREDFRMLAAFFADRAFRRVTHRVRFIRLAAVIAPLLGLTGTVLGMVTVFRDLSGSQAPDPAVLASGIWQALITTVMGLCIAVPASFFNWYLSGRLRDFRAEALGYSLRIRLSLTAVSGGEAEYD
ncbi:MotA/TolQ/ExbB proton channel family protein [Succinimonas sp.]|uniref:MotA/TolQ/ExbB proton channel family protein n=1 Tax=Succinimonas sp. TaxID=1936151 RepID=UPI00386E58A3